MAHDTVLWHMSRRSHAAVTNMSRILDMRIIQLLAAVIRSLDLRTEIKTTAPSAPANPLLGSLSTRWGGMRARVTLLPYGKPDQSRVWRAIRQIHIVIIAAT